MAKKSQKTEVVKPNVQLFLHGQDISKMQGQAIAFFTAPNAQKDKAAHIIEKDLNEVFQDSLDDKSVTGASGEVVFFREANLNQYRHVLLVGLGAKTALNSEIVRQAGAAFYKSTKTEKLSEVFVHVDSLSSNKKELYQYVKAFSEGIGLASYSFDDFKTKAKTDKKTVSIHFVSKSGKDKAMVAAFQEAIIMFEAINFSKRLGDMPPNFMTPTLLGESVVEAAQGSGLKVTVWDKKRIEKENMQGLLAVAQGSNQEPKFIVMEYFGGKKTDKPACFVGKGLTFDSGGISLKPGAKMEEMKFDMCGGANVIGTMLAVARLKLKTNVIAFVPSTENMPNGRAAKPSDIFTGRNGVTYEINNTDAEGRLILSDALSWASEQKPKFIVDAATLTGAIVLALGNIHTGVFARNEALMNKINKASDEAGELVWRMPLTDQHLKDMKGTYADLSNISYSGGAGSATAAAFLGQFVDNEIPWAHFDIAGTAWACGNRLNYCTPKGATGVMIRTFVELVKNS